jgi:hypothetical protein
MQHEGSERWVLSGPLVRLPRHVPDTALTWVVDASGDARVFFDGTELRLPTSLPFPITRRVCNKKLLVAQGHIVVVSDTPPGVFMVTEPATKTAAEDSTKNDAEETPSSFTVTKTRITSSSPLSWLMGTVRRSFGDDVMGPYPLLDDSELEVEVKRLLAEASLTSPSTFDLVPCTRCVSSTQGPDATTFTLLRGASELYHALSFLSLNPHAAQKFHFIEVDVTRNPGASDVDVLLGLADDLGPIEGVYVTRMTTSDSCSSHPGVPLPCPWVGVGSDDLGRNTLLFVMPREPVGPLRVKGAVCTSQTARPGFWSDCLQHILPFTLAPLLAEGHGISVCPENPTYTWVLQGSPIGVVVLNKSDAHPTSGMLG